MFPCHQNLSMWVWTEMCIFYENKGGAKWPGPIKVDCAVQKICEWIPDAQRLYSCTNNLFGTKRTMNAIIWKLGSFRWKWRRSIKKMWESTRDRYFHIWKKKSNYASLLQTICTAFNVTTQLNCIGFTLLRFSSLSVAIKSVLITVTLKISAAVTAICHF